MFVDVCSYRRGEKTYTRALLRTSFREEGKVKHATVANISHLPAEEIAILKEALGKKKKNTRPTSVAFAQIESASVRAKAKFGAPFVLDALARRLGFHEAFGKGRPAKLALWLVYARLLGFKSRLAASRGAQRYDLESVFEPGSFDEDDLYEALTWLCDNQRRIEDALGGGSGRGKKSVFLYDVTSSYLEGDKNELGDWGYNRDGKKGKKQIVIGLLTDADGGPLSVEAFAGNTNDQTTCTKKIGEIKERFSADRIVLVGDRGMIKGPQIERMAEENDGSDALFNYIGAITKPQIEKLLRTDVFQMALFDESVSEIVDGNVRYVLRRNPVRADEIEANRAAKLEKVQSLAKLKTDYLQQAPRAQADAAARNVNTLIVKLKLKKWARAKADGRTISVFVDEEARAKATKLDGCYVIKTDIVAKEVLSAERVHSLYKDLSQVEWAFRTSKSELDNRPFYVRREDRTRGHIFSVMLAYKLHRALMNPLKPHLDEILQLSFDGPVSKKQTLTHKDILEELDMILKGEMEIVGVVVPKIVEPTPAGKRILEIFSLRLPVPKGKKSNVATKKTE